MATAKEESWQIKKRADACTGTGLPFADGEAIMTRLIFRDGEYIREDYSLACWKEQNPERGLSAWKSFFHEPALQEESIQKETAESLLRKLATRNDPEDLNAIYILAVILERKKILVEKNVQIRDDRTLVRVYEHKKSGETFLIIDPDIQMADIEAVQEDVVELLGGKLPKTKTVHRFETLIDLLVEKYRSILFPGRTVGGEEGIAQKLAACTIARLGTNKNPFRAEADNIFRRFENTPRWRSVIANSHDLIECLPREVRTLGQKNPAFARRVDQLAAKEFKDIHWTELQTLFALENPQIDGLRKQAEELVRTAIRYTA